MHYYTEKMRQYFDIPITVTVTFIITVVMLWPASQYPSLQEPSDKLIHIIAFAALVFPLACTGRFGLLPILIGSCTFGGVIEILQSSFGRNAELKDWVADITGVVCGIGLAFCYRRIRR